jgi:SNF2 family DNA or RNA helicase
MLLASSAVGYGALLGEILSDCDSPKIDYVSTRARELAVDGRKVVIWSSFVRNVELIASRLADLGADYIHGKVEAGSEEEEATREAKLKRFKDDPDAFVLVGNPAACGEGISLHEHCHYAIYLDRNFNAAQYLQSEDRIHRLGLPKDQVTTVEIVIAPNTIDDSVHRRLIEKISRMGEVINDPDLHPDPISFDLDDEGLDRDDVKAVLEHISEKETASS